MGLIETTAMKEPQNDALAASLAKCIVACENCANACLEESNVAEMKYCIRLDRDCVDICALTLRLLVRDSRYTDRAIDLCMDACHACEQECSLHKHDHCVLCAAACKECHEQLQRYRA